MKKQFICLIYWESKSEKGTRQHYDRIWFWESKTKILNEKICKFFDEYKDEKVITNVQLF